MSGYYGDSSPFLGDRKRLDNDITSIIKNLSTENPTASRYSPRQVDLGEGGLALSMSLRPKLRPEVSPIEEERLQTPDGPLRPKRRPENLLSMADPTAISSISDLSQKDLNKLIWIESGGKGYEAENKSSGAYGKYQFIPKTAKAWAGKLGISLDDWKKPENQDRMFAAFTNDNIRRLKARGLPVDAFHIYGAHQQGIGGLSSILKGEITPQVRRNILANLPGADPSLGDKELSKAWINHWKGMF